MSTQLALVEQLQVGTDNVARVSSRTVAETFGKDHKNIVRDIDSLECSKDFHTLNFEPVETTEKNWIGGAVKSREFLMTRDGFTFLAMGFTGAKAAQFKEAYIAAFNAMEQRLAAKLPAERITQLDVLKGMFAAMEQQQATLIEHDTRLQLVTAETAEIKAAVQQTASQGANATLTAAQAEQLVQAMKQRAYRLRANYNYLSTNQLVNQMKSCVKNYFFAPGIAGAMSWNLIYQADLPTALEIVETWDPGQNHHWAAKHGTKYRAGRSTGYANSAYQ